MANLSDYGAVETALFVDWEYEIPVFSYASQTERFSNFYRPVTIDGNVYAPMEKLITITPMKNQLNSSDSGITLTWTGMDANDNFNDWADNVREFLNREYYSVKGSKITIRRAFFEPNTNNLLPLDVNPVIRYRGIVTNWSFKETYDPVAKVASVILTVNTTDIKNYLKSYASGRFTDPRDDGFNDKNFERIKKLKGQKIEWGNR